MTKRCKLISKVFLTLLIMSTAVASALSQETNSDQKLLKLKVYHIDNMNQEKRIDSYLENAFIPAMHRLGHDPVGVFKPVGQDTSSNKRIYVLTSYDSFDQIAALDQQLSEDQKYQKSGSSFINAAHDNPAFSEIETILLRAFSYAPHLMESNLDTPREERIYELRSYESATEADNVNKVEMFNEGGEVELFDELNFNAIFYGNVVAGSNMPNLMYMISFDDMQAREAHWDSFVNAPAWEKISSMDKYQNNVSHIDNYFLHAAEYSDL